jgi:tetratricopeptide (TPR) repeat protein
VNELKARSSALADAAINPSDVLRIELAANYVANTPDRVDHLVRTTLSQKKPDPILVDTVVQVAAFYQDYTNALRALDTQLQISPDNVVSLINKGYLELQVSNFNAAIPPLSKAIALAPTNATAIFCRAVSYFKTDRLDEAQKDYDALRQMNPKAFPAYHGLAEVALKKKDTNAAIQWFKMDFTNAPPNSPEAHWATDQLKSLGKPPP